MTKPVSRSIRSLSRSGNFGFVAAVLAVYVSATLGLSYNWPTFTWVKATVLIAASALYLAVGVLGFNYCKRTGSSSSAAAYFAIQLGLAAIITYYASGSLTWLMMLPLVSQGVVLLPGRWVLALCATTLAILLTPIGLRAGLTVATVLGFIYLAGLVFVAVFTHIAVSERRARAEVERLATELVEANGKLREYAAQVEELATAKERNRLAREIHDSLGHYLTVINVQIEAARAVIVSDHARALDVLGKAQSLTREGLVEVRRSVAALHALPTEGRTLPEAVGALLDECRAAGILAEIEVAGLPRQVAPQAELTFYRAAQEGLTNVRKHARASRADVTLDYSNDRLVRLIVKDDGVGAGNSQGGFGLLGVRERAHLLGGEMRVSSAAGRGFTLEVELPV
ncbi:MAG: sensor histidine kinase [Blastocatellia bacterium]|nr:sensor histidine kinase [Blastocatellia bacterium]